MNVLTKLPALAPCIPLSDLFPARTALCLKADTHTMRWVHYDDLRIDAASGSFLSIRGAAPVVCHENTATPSILKLQRRAGLQPTGELLIYRNMEEAAMRAAKLGASGYRFAYTYPPSHVLLERCEPLMPVSLFDWLNDKSNIDRLCDPDWLPPHVLLAPECLDELTTLFPGQGIFVKLCHPGVNGGGMDVLYCADERARSEVRQWVDSRPAGWTGVRVEQELDLRASWCCNVAVTSSGERYLGAATQLFSAPGKQSGSLIDPSSQPGSETCEVALRIARIARGMGFVGMCGLDIGETPDGRPCVFDLNFRLAACSEQVLLHDSATSRVGARVSLSWRTAIPAPLDRVMEHLEPLVAVGRFIPFRMYERTAAEGDISRAAGMLVGDDLDQLAANAEALTAAVDAEL